VKLKEEERQGRKTRRKEVEERKKSRKEGR
jgi:hypothetical protein